MAPVAWKVRTLRAGSSVGGRCAAECGEPCGGTRRKGDAAEPGAAVIPTFPLGNPTPSCAGRQRWHPPARGLDPAGCAPQARNSGQARASRALPGVCGRTLGLARSDSVLLDRPIDANRPRPRFQTGSAAPGTPMGSLRPSLRAPGARRDGAVPVRAPPRVTLLSPPDVAAPPPRRPRRRLPWPARGGSPGSSGSGARSPGPPRAGGRRRRTSPRAPAAGRTRSPPRP